jgi:hypothetical protein
MLISEQAESAAAWAQVSSSNQLVPAIASTDC